MFLPQLLIVSAALLGAVYGQLTITSPSSSIWWITGEQGNLAWTCNTAPATETTWTVMVANPNVQLLTDEQAIVAEQPNYDCSILFTPQLPAGTGYTILFVNPLNTSDVWATSETFEVKPTGSAYAVTSASSSTGSTGTSTAGAAGASQTSKAEGLHAGAAGLVAALVGGVWALL
ncbi:hypothetical protein CALCODRAFT_499107 [Calocera cornea HHB12733]|uniref:Uncharacterized protein n=1 Tax=Calocera cornea HHB12733 TaxID=1353952 RepID=A0A165EK89_9BASI|nr:hypothetical protein CALCODRAFT_499107 [Calocera cornea HHB12733]